MALHEQGNASNQEKPVIENISAENITSGKIRCDSISLQMSGVYMDEVFMLPGGTYRPYEVKGKYGVKPKLPKHYHIIVIDDEQLKNVGGNPNASHTI